MKGRLQEGLVVDEKLVTVCPTDPTAHYNLACRYAMLKQRDKAIVALRRAVELGYRDFAFMQEDHDLDSIRKDPRFRKLLKEYQGREENIDPRSSQMTADLRQRGREESLTLVLCLQTLRASA